MFRWLRGWFVWLWQRFGDLNTLGDLVGLLGLKSMVAMFVTGLGTALATAWSHPASPFIVFNALLVALVIGVFSVVWQQHRSGVKRASEHGSPLKVDYEEGAGSFYQENPTHAPGLGKGTLQLARIRITGKKPVENVQVKVFKVVPEQRHLGGVPFHLQLMNDNTEPYRRSILFAKDQEEYFDVVSYAKFMMNTGQLRFRRIDKANGIFSDVPCDIWIQITGLHINSIECCFRIWVDKSNNLRMTRCSSSQS